MTDTTLGPVRAGPHGDPVRGDIVGRFIVLDVIGRGAGGRVLAAYDPSLDRRVALKLVPGHQPAEAQALARLSHPNVVAVHEVGVFEDGLFIAMELLEGDTLERWLAAPRSRHAIVSAFVEVGRGLAAAHRVGLVHGDVKPRNVIVGRDGRIRLVDFGLAREPGEGDGVARGTPRYMAPEQAQADAIDARSDQYSFCVSLDEALELASVARPPWLTGLLRRGLAQDPAHRYPSVDALVDDLARDRGSRYWRRVGVVGVAAVAALAAWNLTRDRGASALRACPDPLALIASVWNEDRRTLVGANAGLDGEIVLPMIDRFVRDWVAMRAEACTVERVDSEHLFALRTACLDEARVALDETLRVLEETELGGGRAVIAVEGLPRLDRCADAAWLLARVKPPTDPDVITAVAVVRAQLQRVRSLYLSGRYPSALAAAEHALSAAQTAGHEPVHAEALYLLAAMLAYNGRHASALERYREAARAGLRSGHYEIVAHAWDELTYMLASVDRQAAFRSADDAEALLSSLPDSDLLMASVRGRRAVLLAGDHRYEEAIRELRRTVEVRTRLLGPGHSNTALAHYYLAEALQESGDYAGALEHAMRASELLRTHVSANHPFVVSSSKLVGLSLVMQGKPDEAIAVLTPLLAMLHSALGPDPFAVGAEVHDTLATALRARGRLEEALVRYRVAIETFEARDPDDGRAAISRSNLARTLLELDRLDEAGVEQERALARAEVVLANDPELSGPLLAAALYQHARGEPESALELLERALELRARRGRTHPRLCEIVRPLRAVRKQLGKPPLEHPNPNRCPGQ